MWPGMGPTLQHPHGITTVSGKTLAGPRASVSPGGEGLSVGPPTQGCAGLSIPSQSLSHGSSRPRGSRSRPSCTGAAARTSTPTTTCPGRYTSARRCGGGDGGQHGDRLVSKCYGDKGGFSPRPCRVGDAGDAGEPGWSPSWQVFYPKDSINNPLLLDLVFRQVRH